MIELLRLIAAVCVEYEVSDNHLRYLFKPMRRAPRKLKEPRTVIVWIARHHLRYNRAQVAGVFNCSEWAIFENCKKLQKRLWVDDEFRERIERILDQVDVGDDVAWASNHFNGIALGMWQQSER